MHKIDTFNGISTEMDYNESDDSLIVKRSGDVEPVIDYNKARQNDGTNGASKSGDLKHAARIPFEVIELWNNEYKTNVLARENLPLLRRLLNDPNNKFLRIWKGRL